MTSSSGTPRNTVVYRSPSTRAVRKRDSFAAAMIAPNTAPTASAASVNATVINAASSSTPPQPSCPKPSVSIRAMAYSSSLLSLIDLLRRNRSFEQARTAAARAYGYRSRRDVGLEPLVGKLLHGAVLQRIGDGRIELRLQVGVLLAEREAFARTPDRAADLRSRHGDLR